MTPKILKKYIVNVLVAHFKMAYSRQQLRINGCRQICRHAFFVATIYLTSNIVSQIKKSCLYLSQLMFIFQFCLIHNTHCPWYLELDRQKVTTCTCCLPLMELVNQGHFINTIHQMLVNHMLSIETVRLSQIRKPRYVQTFFPGVDRQSASTIYSETAIFTNKIFNGIKISFVYLCDALIFFYQLYFVVLQEIHVFVFFANYLLCIHCRIEHNVQRSMKMAVACRKVSLNFDLKLVKYLCQKTKNFLLTQFY